MIENCLCFFNYPESQISDKYLEYHCKICPSCTLTEDVKKRNTYNQRETEMMATDVKRAKNPVEREIEQNGMQKRVGNHLVERTEKNSGMKKDEEIESGKSQRREVTRIRKRNSESFPLVQVENTLNSHPKSTGKRTDLAPSQSMCLLVGF